MTTPPRDTPQGWQHVPSPLTPQQLFRLVEIAHDTTNMDIRLFSLRLLDNELNPIVILPPPPKGKEAA